MPRGIKAGEEPTGEANTESVNFRVPKSMKAEFRMFCEFEEYASIGELFRALWRKHRTEVLNSQAYKYWLQRKQEEATRKLRKESMSGGSKE